MSRKSGCPFNIRDYAVTMKDQVTGEYVRVKGLDTMKVEVEADTEDGGTGESLWAEMFIKGRSVSGSIGGRPIADRVTGARDPGQALMHRAAFSEGGCMNDCTVRVADPVGQAVEYDCVVTGESVDVDEDGEKITWEWEGVGCPRELPYVQASGLAFRKDGAAVSSVSVAVNGTATVLAAFTPENASNTRFAYSLADAAVAQVESVDGAEIVIRGMSPGETALTLRSMNNGLTAQLTVRVTG